MSFSCPNSTAIIALSLYDQDTFMDSRYNSLLLDTAVEVNWFAITFDFRLYNLSQLSKTPLAYNLAAA